jgi:lipoprotein LprG
MKNRLSMVVFALLAVLAASCGPRKPLELPADEIINRSVERMKSLKGFHFLIDRSGEPAYLDAAEQFAFRRAEGEFVSPDKAIASVRIITPGVVGEIQAVGIGDRYWETNYLTGNWEELPSGIGFNPAVLFDPEVGLQPILQSDLNEIIVLDPVEIEELPDKLLYHLQGKIAGENLYAMSYGLMGPDTMDTEIWIDPNSFDVIRVLITQSRPEKTEPTIWQVDFWNFNKVVDIEPPPVATP